jgi:hypothetical protein
MKDAINKIPVMMKRASFLSVNHIICGKLAVKLAKVAPIPIETRVTGKAQHKRVLKEPNSEKKETTLFII